MTAMTYLLDTNICIYLIKRHPPAVLKRLNTVPAGAVLVSAISVAELAFGVEKSQRGVQNLNALEQFLLPLRIVDFDRSAAIVYGKLRADLERRGEPIGSMDTLIAAQALSLDAILVTNNSREFGRVAGLRIENWASD